MKYLIKLIKKVPWKYWNLIFILVIFFGVFGNLYNFINEGIFADTDKLFTFTWFATVCLPVFLLITNKNIIKSFYKNNPIYKNPESFILKLFFNEIDISIKINDSKECIRWGKNNMKKFFFL